MSCGEEGRCTGIEQCNCTEGWSIPQCDDVTKGMQVCMYILCTSVELMVD